MPALERLIAEGLKLVLVCCICVRVIVHAPANTCRVGFTLDDASHIAMQVCNVGAHSCQLLRSQGYTAHELLEVAVASGFTPALMWRLMSAILGQLTALAPGQYLLTHQPAARAICLFTASASAEQTAEVRRPFISALLLCDHVLHDS